jgi:hypothetical protein
VKADGESDPADIRLNRRFHRPQHLQARHEERDFTRDDRPENPRPNVAAPSDPVPAVRRLLRKTLSVSNPRSAHAAVRRSATTTPRSCGE